MYHINEHKINNEQNFTLIVITFVIDKWQLFV